MKAKRVHAGYSQREWRLIRGFPTGKLPPLEQDPAPREESEIALDLRDQLEQIWRRFPREFR